MSSLAAVANIVINDVILTIYILVKYVEKFKEGVFSKLKARLLLGGDMLKNLSGDSSGTI